MCSSDLPKNGHQHVGPGDFLFAIACALHVHDGALDHALKAQSGLGVHLFSARDLGRVVFDEIGQRFAKVVDVGRASSQHLGGAGVVQQRQEQVLHRDELMTLLPGLHEGHVQTDFKFLGNHDFFLGAVLGSTVYGFGGVLFNRFTVALQGMTRLVGGIADLIDFGGGHILGIHAANTFAIKVDFQHDLGGSLSILAKKGL